MDKLDKTEKLSLIDRFESAIEPLIDFVRSAPAQAVDFRPSLPGAWSIRDHAVHFLDADTFAYGRLRLTITQPGAEVFVWNEDAWQQRARYETADALTSLETARALRRVACAMARALVDENWDEYYVQHPQRGRLSLTDIFTLYADHAQFHLSYFRRNLDAFQSSRA